jgi:hypothetical protein
MPGEAKRKTLKSDVSGKLMACQTSSRAFDSGSHPPSGDGFVVERFASLRVCFKIPSPTAQTP